MNRQLKPRRYWGITYATGNDVMPDTIRRTRAEAQSAACRDDGLTWNEWHRAGCRAVRVTVTVEPKA